MERTDLNISLPLSLNQDQTFAASSSTQNPIVFRPPVQPILNSSNLLNTILEESLAENVSVSPSPPMVFSTPVVQNEYEAETRRVGNELMTSQSPLQSPPRRSKRFSSKTSSPSSVRLSAPARRPKRSVLDDTSSDDEPISPEKNSFVSRRRKKVSVDLTEDEDNEETSNVSQSEAFNTTVQTHVDTHDVSNEVPSDAHDASYATHSNAHDASILSREKDHVTSEIPITEVSISQNPLRTVLVNVTKLITTPNTTNRYKKIFHAKTPEEILIESDDDERENRAGNDSFASNSSQATTTSCSTATSYTSSTVLRASRKIKATSDVPRRSTGRPKRKARPLVASLAEKKLNRKMRRSK